jgi:3-oxoacyl-[acyl-carrier-protein] synthase II
LARDVWVTGLGAVTAYGRGVAPLLRGCREGRLGIRPIQRFPTSDLACRVGGEIEGEWPRRRESAFAREAAAEAVADARLPGPEPRGEIFVGILQPDAAPLEHGEEAFGNEAPDEIARELGWTGFSAAVGTACSAAAIAVALAAERIGAGIADAAIAGGTASLFRAAHAGLAQMGAMAPNVCRPFDRDREGVILGEGAGFLVLEESGRARRRGARPYARIRGAGISCDAFHPLAMDRSGAGLRRCLEEAVRSSAADPAEIRLVVAHGTGTRLNDATETDAIARVYGPRSEVVSLKPYTGHTMSASAGISAVLACRMFRERFRLGTPTLRAPDPSLPALAFPNDCRESWRPGLTAIHAFGFGGQNACLLLEPLP